MCCNNSFVITHSRFLLTSLHHHPPRSVPSFALFICLWKIFILLPFTSPLLHRGSKILPGKHSNLLVFIFPRFDRQDSLIVNAATLCMPSVLPLRVASTPPPLPSFLPMEACCPSPPLNQAFTALMVASSLCAARSQLINITFRLKKQKRLLRVHCVSMQPSRMEVVLLCVHQLLPHRHQRLFHLFLKSLC